MLPDVLGRLLDHLHDALAVLNDALAVLNDALAVGLVDGAVVVCGGVVVHRCVVVRDGVVVWAGLSVIWRCVVLPGRRLLWLGRPDGVQLLRRRLVGRRDLVVLLLWLGLAPVTGGGRREAVGVEGLRLLPALARPELLLLPSRALGRRVIGWLARHQPLLSAPTRSAISPTMRETL